MIAPDEIIVDSFAGGGGASLGIAWATGRAPDVAINHDPVALAIHQANHPATRHLIQNVWQADPREVAAGRKVGLAWFSPDCTHHSKAKGGQPRKQNIRDLAWVVVLWAQRARPRLIFLENVEEFRAWGPLDAAGMPVKALAGMTFDRWVRQLRKLGYAVDWRELRACDYGAPTIRKRLFLVARCDGLPIVWPAPTHARNGEGGLPPWRSAASCIDWSLPCPSIFGRRKPLAEATMRRIAKGVMRYVVNAARPFIVPITHRGDDRVHGIDEPLRTVTTAHRGEHAVVVPSIVGVGGRAGQSPERDAGAPLGTVTASKRGTQALCAAFLAQHNTGMVGHDAREPVSTIVGKGSTQALVAAYMAQHNGGRIGRPVDEPVSTVVHRGTQQQLVAATLSHAYSSNSCGGNGDPTAPVKTVTTGGHHALVAAFLEKYYGSGGQHQGAGEPLRTATAKPRFGLVTVTIDGIPYAIVDIGMRMLTPRELFRAQGFPDSYVIDPIVTKRRGKREVAMRLDKTAQTKACGNSVCPHVGAALIRANLAAGAAAQAAE